MSFFLRGRWFAAGSLMKQRKGYHGFGVCDLRARLLRGAQSLGEQRRTLPVVPRAMIASDRVVMGDGPAIRNHRVERRAFDGAPLCAELARLAECVEREICRGAVGIDMREAAGDLPLAAGRLAHRVFS